MPDKRGSLIYITTISESSSRIRSFILCILKDEGICIPRSTGYPFLCSRLDHFFKCVTLDDVAGDEFVKSFQSYAAFPASANFIDIVFFMFEGCDFTFKQYLVSPANAGVLVAVNFAFADFAPGDISNL